MNRNDRKKTSFSNVEETERRFFDWLRRGTEALHQGEIAKAIRFLERAHQLNPANGDAALNLSGAYILAKKFKLAVAILEPLSQREPYNPMVWTNLGAAYLGNPVLAGEAEQQQAIAAFEQAIELNPAAPNVAYNLGLIYLGRQDQPRASHWFERAVQANPADRDARRYLEQLSLQIRGNDSVSTQ